MSAVDENAVEAIRRAYEEGSEQSGGAGLHDQHAERVVRSAGHAQGAPDPLLSV